MLKERWSLSARGWLIIFAAALGAFSLFVFRIYPFLAVTHSVHADILVVEGWIHEYAIRAAADEFRSGAYRRVFTTGGPVMGTGHYINDFQTSASVGADLLRKAGVPDESLQMVPSRTMDWDRTYSSAIALRDWIEQHEPFVRRINVVTEGTHARRTRLLFQKALGKNVQIGIIAVPNPDYPANRWWRYSEGLKDVVSESAAYLHARLLCLPFACGARTPGFDIILALSAGLQSYPEFLVPKRAGKTPVARSGLAATIDLMVFVLRTNDFVD